MNKLFFIFALMTALAGCDAVSTMKDGFEQSQAVAADLEKMTGTKPFVGFNWQNGFLGSVTVTFEGMPQNRTLPEIAELSRGAIKRQFKQEPKQIVVGFSIKP